MKYKQVYVCLVLVLIMLVNLSFCVFADNTDFPFEDVPKSEWYYSYVKTAYEKGITNGISKNVFDPYSSVTREMFLAMLFRSTEIDLSYYENIEKSMEAMGDDSALEFWRYYYFDDVPPYQWHSYYVASAKDMGVVEGIGDNCFGLGQAITREQMAAMVERFVSVRLYLALKQAKDPVKRYTDEGMISDWAKSSTEAMRLSGVMQGDEMQRFNPKSNATRAEAVAVILRLTNAIERKSFVPAGTNSILLRDQSNLIEGSPKEVSITKVEDLEKVIQLLDTMPITTEYAKPDPSGWLYCIQFYDENSDYITSYEFSEDWIRFGNTTLDTDDNYFAPLILMLKAD